MDSKTRQQVMSLMRFIHLAERLKFTLRHGWASNGRQESVAEHSWRLALLAFLLAPYTQVNLNMEKVFGMAVIHDLCEVLTGDTPFFEAIDGSPEKRKKQMLEEEAMKTLTSLLDRSIGDKFHTLWKEYEDGESEESKFVRALDKIEAQVQQNEADISTWNDFEKQSIFTHLDKFCDYNDFLQLFKDVVRNESIAKLKTASVAH